jgi:hypothetical protein
MNEKKTTRVQMDLPDASIQRLKLLKDKTEASSYAEVTKNAYRLYERMIGYAESGNSFFLKDEKGDLHQLDLLF